MTCYHTEAEFTSGRRYIPVRRTDGELWLHTQYVAETAAEAAEAAMLSNRMELHPEWVAENELVGVAVVDMTIHDLWSLEMLGVSRQV